MMNRSLAGKRVLITQADVFMGPVLCEVFAGHGATVIASTGSLVSAGAPAAIGASTSPNAISDARNEMAISVLLYATARRP